MHVTLPNDDIILTTYDEEGEDTLKAGANMLITGAGYTALGQLAFLDRPAGTLDTILDYHDQTENYRLAAVRHGTAGDALPDYGYTGYDAAGNLTGMTMTINSAAETFAFGYDDLDRLTSASLTGAPAPGTANFSYTYAYNELGNIMARTGTAPALTYTYGEGAAGPQAVTKVTQSVGQNLVYAYGLRGNLDSRIVGTTLTHDYVFDTENRLTAVAADNKNTIFTYDAGGQRVKSVVLDQNGTTLTTVYTPFPDYEVTVSGTTESIRTTYRLAGRIVAVRTSTGAINHVAFDHLGSVGALFNGSGTYIGTSQSRFDPFGNFRTPPTGSNPTITNHGFTGHRHNNLGSPDLGLIYMNARYYLPEVGRFISPDSLVPNAINPQSHNRYSYGYNNPVKYTDPSGHYAQCSATGSDGFYANCDEWMTEAIRVLGLEGGLEGARLAELFWQWFNDPGKMLYIKAYYAQAGMMYTRQFTADTASIFIDMNVASGFGRGDIALLGHELEHVSQGTWQAWSIQGEVLAYQVEYRIREAMGIGQSSNTAGAMGELDPVRPPYNAHSYPDLAEAKSGFLDDPLDPHYNVWYEPNLPWGQEIAIAYSTGQKEMARSLIVDSSWLTTTIDRWIP